jgi:DNA repair protein RecO (recombination protein O)
MKTERVALTPVFVLHQYPWRETSRIVEIWSREHGRLGLVARGVRRPKSPFRGLLQPFMPLLLSWSLRGELGNLTGAEMTGVRTTLRGRPLLAAYYLNELLLRLLPRQDIQASLYDCYVATLGCLARKERPAASVRVFEKRLLAAAGYGLNLEYVLPLRIPVQPDMQYSYDLDAGPTLAVGRRSHGLLITGRALLALGREQLDDAEDLRAARRLLQAALERRLDGRPLKTSSVMRALSK